MWQAAAQCHHDLPTLGQPRWRRRLAQPDAETELRLFVGAAD
jgi:hypothetical protein